MATSSDPAPLAADDLCAAPAADHWVRITGTRFTDALGWGPGESRFVPAGATWGGIYVTTDIVTAFREAVVRDRALAAPSLLSEEDFTRNDAVIVQLPTNLRLVDLVDGPLSTLLDTDRRAGRTSKDPGAWSAAWRQDPLQPHGILYPSRFTGRACIFVYDRAIPRIKALWRRRIDQLPDPHGAVLAFWVNRHVRRFLPPR